MTAIRGRNGEAIPIDEYPVGYMERLNDRLNAIAEEDAEESLLDRAAEKVLDVVTKGGLVAVGILALGLFLVAAAVQVGRWI